VANWRFHIKQWDHGQHTPLGEFFLIVPGDTMEEARQALMTDIEYWASINQICKADHNQKNQPYPPQIYVFYKGVHTQILDVKRVRDNASN